MTRVRAGLTWPLAGGLMALTVAAALVIVAPPGIAPIVVAGLATVMIGLDPRFGPIPGAIVVLLAIPFGRAAGGFPFELAGVPVRPADAIVAVGLLGALLSPNGRPTMWPVAVRRLGGLGRVMLILGLLFGGLGILALGIGVVEGHAPRDILRDARWWLLYLSLPAVILSGLSREAAERALLVGGTAFAIVVLATVILPAFEGGLKDQALVYDRGTLRMQFGNTVFVLPAIALAARQVMVRASWTATAWLAVLVVAVVLSLTRIAVAVTLGTVVLTIVATIIFREVAWSRRLARPAAMVGVAAVVALVGGIALDIAGTPNMTTVAGESPVGRLIFQGDQSDLDTAIGSGSGRFTTYRNALDLIATSPVVGHGLGSLVDVPFAYDARRAHTLDKQPGVDNAYLTVAMKAGVIGVAAFGALLLWVLLPLRREPRLRTWLLPSWLGILALTMTQSFAVSSYGPFALGVVAAVGVLGYASTRGATAAAQV